MSDCVEAVYKALAGKVQRKTIQSWNDQISERLDKKGAFDPKVVERELAALGKQRIREAFLRRRNTALMIKSENNFYNYVISEFKDNPVKGMIAVLGGVQSYKGGSRRSAALHQQVLEAEVLSRLEIDLRRGKLFDDFKSGEMDKDVAKELADLSMEVPTNKATENQAAKKIAVIIKNVQEKARLRANAAGADIGKLQGYFTAQTHDMWKIRKVGRDAWVDDLMAKLDRKETFGDDVTSEREMRDILGSLYSEFASGDHTRIKSEPPALSARTSGSNIGGSLSKERFLHFKSVDDALDYNQQFGRGNLRENIVDSLSSISKKTALMEILGPNPNEVLDRVYARIKNEYSGNQSNTYDQKIVNSLKDSRQRMDKLMKVIDGSASIPANEMLAKWSQIARDIQSMSKLGGAVISATSDIAFGASELRYQGLGFLSAYNNTIVGGFNNVPRAMRRELGAMMGVYSDASIHSMTNRASGNVDFSGRSSRAMTTFFKWSGLTDWTDRMRINVALAMSARIGSMENVKFADMDPDLKRTLGLFSIDNRDWKAIQKAIREVEGNKFSTPESVLELTDAEIKSIYGDVDFDKTRQMVSDKLRSYYIDRTEHAVLVPDARTTAIMRQGTQAGTPEGEFIRFIMQFKAFPISLIQKVYGRTLYGKEKFGVSGAMEVAHLVAVSTALGYVSMTVKDLIKGRTPRDPLDPTTIMAAMAQGGSLGIYGDYILGTSNRYGGSVVATAAGPFIGSVEQAVDILMSIRDGDDPSAKALKLVQGNIPFANIFYLKAVLDYAIVYQIQEMLDPGYLNRMEDRVRSTNKQEFMFAPSDIIQYGGGFK